MSSLKGDAISSRKLPDNAFNHWDDGFVQSMETPYLASEYRERAETLVKQVKTLLKEMQTGSDGDLIQRLEMVDALQCLGIDRYFQDEIKEALDFVYRCWDGSVGIGEGSESCSRNLNATVLALRLLRLHRYHVSADVLQNFKDENGQFLKCGGKNDNNMKSSGEEHVVRSILNLLRAASVAFPGETIMQEAKVFSSLYLKQVLKNIEDTYKSSLLKEVEYGLIYEWPRTFTIWEAQNFIEIYDLDNSRLKNVKILELAKLNFNILQCVYKMEMKTLSSWWQNSGISKLIALRERSIEYLLMGISVMDEMEFSSTRIAVAKVATLVTILDDLFDDYLTLEQVELVTGAIIQGWNVSLIQNLPNNFKKIVEFVSKIVNELSSDATKKQGRDMTQFIAKAWADYAEANLQQARWNKSGYVPTYNEYINIARTSASIGPLSLHSILLTTILANNDIEKIFLNRSRLCELVWLSLRLADDAQDFQDEKLHGQTASAVSSYMRDHAECLEDDALCHINCLANQLIKELMWEFLNPNKKFLDYEKLCFNLSKGIQCFYVFGDGFTYPEKGIKQQVLKVLVDPVKI